MAKKYYRLDDPHNFEEIQKLLYETDDETNKLEFDAEYDLENNDKLEVLSENFDSVQDIFSDVNVNDKEETVDDKDEKQFLGKAKYQN